MKYRNYQYGISYVFLNIFNFLPFFSETPTKYVISRTLEIQHFKIQDSTHKYTLLFRFLGATKSNTESGKYEKADIDFFHSFVSLSLLRKKEKVTKITN